MKMTFQDIVNDLVELEVAAQLNTLLLSQYTGIKIDPVAGLIAKIVYVEHTKKNTINITQLSNTLHETENTIRKKINYLKELKLIKCKVSKIDARQKSIEPTGFLTRVFIVDAARKLKTIEDISPLLKHLFGKRFADMYKEYDVVEHVSYKETLTGAKYRQMLKRIEAKAELRNTLNKLG